MDGKFEPLQPDEVASLGKDFKGVKEMFDLPLAFKAEEVHINIANFLINHASNHQETRKQLLNESLDGEVLKFGADGWQKGKIRCRIIVEFCPDESEESEIPEQSQGEKSAPDSFQENQKHRKGRKLRVARRRIP